jgi:glutathione S-transferase
MSKIILYELCGGSPEQVFSPHCWKVRMALAHKRLPYETRAVGFAAISAIGNGFSTTVPIIDDGGTLIRDSFDIALYLERTYPDRPSLFGGPGGIGTARFVERWCQFVVHPPLLRMLVADIHNLLAESDRSYFRADRERKLGASLETVQADREQRVGAFRDALRPLREMLAMQPFVGGQAPFFADYIVFGALQWARVGSPFKVLAEDDPVAEWFRRCLELHGGLGLATKAAA